MIDKTAILALVGQVALLVIMLIPGFLMKKLKFGDGGFAKGLANFTLYIAQSAMLVRTFIMDYNPKIMLNMIYVFVYSLVAHAIFLAIAMMFFKKVKIEKQKVLRFAIIFSNAGYMGIPLIEAFLGADAAVYAAVYNIGFSFFIWSIGCYLYSGDRSYMSFKKMFINPAMVSIYIGLIFFFTPLSDYIMKATVVMNAIDSLKAMTSPLAMVLVGYHMASVDWKNAFRDIKVYECMALRLIACPVIIWGVMKILMLQGLCTDTAMQVVLICSATPCATSVGIFAEKFNCDTVTSGKLIPMSTVAALATMPVVALLLLV